MSAWTQRIRLLWRPLQTEAAKASMDNPAPTRSMSMMNTERPSASLEAVTRL